jgi:hypothetical protein
MDPLSRAVAYRIVSYRMGCDLSDSEMAALLQMNSAESESSSAASDELADEEEEEVDEIMGMEEDTVAMHAAYRTLNAQLADFRAAHKKELEANPPAPQPMGMVVLHGTARHCTALHGTACPCPLSSAHLAG